MKKVLRLLPFLLLLAGCGQKPLPWLAAGYQLMENYKTYYLAGRPAAATELHFQKALEEIKKSGDLNLLGKVWLTRMALQVAVLEEPQEGDYPRIEAAERVEANRNFYRFLKGDAAVNGSLLPQQYRSFHALLQAGNADEAVTAAARIEDPLSRLIASGLAVRRFGGSEPLLRTAVDTASRNGWKRALLAWLKRLGVFYEASGEAAKAEAVRRRIDLIAS